MKLPSGLVEARVVGRLRRFSVEVEIDGERVVAHLANSGRLQGLLEPGTPALAAPSASPRRQSHYDLLMVRPGVCWVAVDARLPNPLLREALAAGCVRPLAGYAEISAEARSGASRIDYLLSGPDGRCLVETKSVTLVEGGIARFPDAPTLRGVRQLNDLVAARRAGYAAAVVFVVQREDAASLRPNAEVDPGFTTALHQAASEKVAVLAYRCEVSPLSIRLAERIPVRL
jgi:sugar fermentation stimulation protein A